MAEHRWNGNEFYPRGTYSTGKLSKIAGLSWGVFDRRLKKFKGDIDKAMDERFLTDKIRVCRICRTPTKGGGKFCQSSHSSVYYNKLKDRGCLNPDGFNTCVICDATFPYYFELPATKKVKTCCSECRKRLQSDRNRTLGCGDGDLASISGRRNTLREQQLLDAIPSPTKFDYMVAGMSDGRY